MSNIFVYGTACGIFFLQLALCFKSNNPIVKKLLLAVVFLPAVLGVGYGLFYNIRHAWKLFVISVYLYVSLVWLAAFGAAWLIYRLINKTK